MQQATPRAHWATRVGFILAAAGSSIGLGNIWKFPYVAGENGGGLFILFYLLCVVVIGVPIMLAEFLIGRTSERDAVGAFSVLAGRRSPWRTAGWIAMGAAFLLFSFYSVIAGWVFHYLFQALQGGFTPDPQQIAGVFQQLVGSPTQVIVWQSLFVLATGGIVVGGIRGGIERWSRILLPLLFVMLLGLVVYGITTPAAGQTWEFMFSPRWDEFSWSIVLEAMGQAFFSMSLGAGVMITYGSYLDKHAHLPSLTFRIAILDTLVALLAGLAIFPAVFSAGIGADAGPGLVFQSVPLVFAQLPFGYILGIVFFLLLSFAALTSSISMLEVAVSYLVDEKGVRRSTATWSLCGVALALGLPSALSFNLWSGVKILAGRTFFDFFDLLVSSYLLPLGGLLVAIYTGWFWPEREEKEALFVPGSSRFPFRIWHGLLRWVAPVALVLVFLRQLGVV
ncbi:MAG: sodium-dependent transporter [Thermodesulfobacteriota bacterium]